jgi:hypothetical protein
MHRRCHGLLIRRFQCGHPDPFRSVRYLGFVAARCSHPSGELQGRSSVWLPAWLPLVGHHHALVLVTTIGPLPGAVTAPSPAQAAPPPVTARTFQGMAPYAGQARCLALGFWPECFRRLDVKGGRRPFPKETRSALDIEGKHVIIQGPSPDLTSSVSVQRSYLAGSSGLAMDSGGDRPR